MVISDVTVISSNRLEGLGFASLSTASAVLGVVWMSKSNGSVGYLTVRVFVSKMQDKTHARALLTRQLEFLV